jgi:hypothetical protein
MRPQDPHETARVTDTVRKEEMFGFVGTPRQAVQRFSAISNTWGALY